MNKNQKNRRPNILIFNPDEMRRDAMHHMGNPAALTPNLDRFAQDEAVSFSRAYCQNPVCTPSRCSFLTGLYPHVHGNRTMNHMIHSYQSTLFKELKKEGYYVWLNDRNDFLPAQEPGYYDQHASHVDFGNVFSRLEVKTEVERGRQGSLDYYSFYRGKILGSINGPYEDNDEIVVNDAIDFIKSRKDTDEPFCIFLGLMSPHPPYKIEEPYYSAIDRSKLQTRIPDIKDAIGQPKILKEIAKTMNMQGYPEERWDELRASYLGMCMKVDDLFGRICDALKETGSYDDTDIYFFSDHGDFTGDYGISEKCENVFKENLVGVPLLIKPHKGVDVDPGISDSFVELIDFYSTAMDLAGIEPDHTNFGNSLRAVLADRNSANREYVFCEGGRLAGEKQAMGGGGKIPLKEFEYYPRLNAQRDDICHTKATMIRDDKWKYVHRLYEKDELYNMINDPYELNNLIDVPEYADIYKQMSMKMLKWYQETCDIVPFKEDDRFNMHYLVERIKCRVSPAEAEEVQNRLDEGTLTNNDILTILARSSGNEENLAEIEEA